MTKNSFPQWMLFKTNFQNPDLLWIQDKKILLILPELQKTDLTKLLF